MADGSDPTQAYWVEKDKILWGLKSKKITPRAAAIQRACGGKGSPADIQYVTARRPGSSRICRPTCGARG